MITRAFFISEILLSFPILEIWFNESAELFNRKCDFRQPEAIRRKGQEPAEYFLLKSSALSLPRPYESR